MITRAIYTVLILLAGFALSVVFYGGLWLTLTHLPKSEHPVALALASFWLRTAVVIAGFVCVALSRWQNALLWAAGFAVGRIVLGRKLPHSAGRRPA